MITENSGLEGFVNECLAKAFSNGCSNPSCKCSSKKMVCFHQDGEPIGFTIDKTAKLLAVYPGQQDPIPYSYNIVGNRCDISRLTFRKNDPMSCFQRSYDFVMANPKNAYLKLKDVAF